MEREDMDINLKIGFKEDFYEKIKKIKIEDEEIKDFINTIKEYTYELFSIYILMREGKIIEKGGMYI